MLPDLPEGMAAQLIQASDTGKLYTLEPDVYIYEVPCRLQSYTGGMTNGSYS